MKVLFQIEGNDVVLDLKTGEINFFGCARIDDDGTGPSHGDPCHQADTSLHHNGKPLNADVDRYIVVPPQIRDAVAPIVLGCQAEVTWNGRTVTAVVGDIGPRHRLGEMSLACARALGINPDPNRGGVDEHTVHYLIQPGVPAVVDGVTYQLQHA